MSDLELLRAFRDEGSQEAFAELVARHVDLVYSAARRQVRSPDLAGEVAQSAFIALARHAHRLKAETSVGAWLYVVTRRAALDVLRRESRRQMRERVAGELADMKTNSPEWTEIEAVLDEAMAGLGDRDRTAVVLRFFENKGLREIGAALGTSEDAAQKRIGRALDQLRVSMARRGVAIGAASLAAQLSAGAVQSAPLGLGATISSATALVGGAGALGGVGALYTFSMTTFQKAVIGTTVAALVGAGFYGQRRLARQDDELRASQGEVAQLMAQNRQLQRDRADDVRLLGDAQTALDAARVKSADVAGAAQKSSDPAMETELKAVLARVVALKDSFAQNAGRQTPEMRYLKDQDWINAAARHKLDSEQDLVAALADVRTSAKCNFAGLMSAALWDYARANEDRIPSDIAQLAPYFTPPVEAGALARYGLVRTGALREVPGDAIVVAEIAPKDGVPEGELYMSGPRTLPGQNNIMVHSGNLSDVSRAVVGAVAGFIKANAGAAPVDPAQLGPFLPAPVDAARVGVYWKAVGLPGNFRAPRD